MRGGGGVGCEVVWCGVVWVVEGVQGGIVRDCCLLLLFVGMCIVDKWWMRFWGRGGEGKKD